MTADEAIRYAAHEAPLCRERDRAEALCLLVPVLLKVCRLKPMDDLEAAAVKYKIKLELRDAP